MKAEYALAVALWAPCEIFTGWGVAFWGIFGVVVVIELAYYSSHES